MSMKSLFFGLALALVLLQAGCGRSKPSASKAPAAEVAPEAEATPPPPDALPPKPVAAPVAAPPPAMTASAPPVSFTPLPAGRDPAADAERQKQSITRAKQAEGLAREKAQRATDLQNQPEGDRDR